MLHWQDDEDDRVTTRACGRVLSVAGGRVEVEFYNFFTVRTKKESTGKNIKKKKYAITNLCKNLFFVCGFFSNNKKANIEN